MQTKLDRLVQTSFLSAPGSRPGLRSSVALAVCPESKGWFWFHVDRPWSVILVLPAGVWPKEAVKSTSNVRPASWIELAGSANMWLSKNRSSPSGKTSKGSIEKEETSCASSVKSGTASTMGSGNCETRCCPKSDCLLSSPCDTCCSETSERQQRPGWCLYDHTRFREYPPQAMPF